MSRSLKWVNKLPACSGQFDWRKFGMHCVVLLSLKSKLVWLAYNIFEDGFDIGNSNVSSSMPSINPCDHIPAKLSNALWPVKTHITIDYHRIDPNLGMRSSEEQNEDTLHLFGKLYNVLPNSLLCYISLYTDHSWLTGDKFSYSLGKSSFQN